MRHWSQLGIRNWRAKPGRTAGGLAAIALGVGVVIWVTCAYESVRLALRDQVWLWTGKGHLSVGSSATEGTIPAAFAGTIKRLSNITHITAQLNTHVLLQPAPVASPTTTTAEIPTKVIQAIGIDPGTEAEFGRYDATRVKGRTLKPGDTDAALMEDTLAADMELHVGDRFVLSEKSPDLQNAQSRKTATFTIVGLVEHHRVAKQQLPIVVAMLDRVQMLSGYDAEPKQVSKIDIIVKDDSFSALRITEMQVRALAAGMMVTSAEARIRQVQAAEQQTGLVLLLLSTVALFTAFFVILSTLSMGTVERVGLLGTLRCLGMTRTQLAFLVLSEAVPLGMLGILLGVPVGFGLAELSVWWVPEYIGQFAINRAGLVLAIVGGAVTTILGSILPMLQAMRVSPLEASRSQSKPPVNWLIWVAALIGAALIAGHALLVNSARADVWFRPGGGTRAVTVVVCLYSGYALITPMLVRLVGQWAVRLVSVVLRLKHQLLSDQVGRATWRSTAICCGLMVGLSLIVSLVVHSKSLAGGWDFPKNFCEAFVHVAPPVPRFRADSARRLPGVSSSAVINISTLCTISSGKEFLNFAFSRFVAGDPDDFFKIARLEFLAGNQEDAIAKLKKGGYVLVTPELVRSKNVGYGDRVSVTVAGGPAYSYVIAGVVTSPAIDIAANYFSASDLLTSNSAQVVLGTQADLRRMRKGLDEISMFLINFDLPETQVPGEFETEKPPGISKPAEFAALLESWRPMLPERAAELDVIREQMKSAGQSAGWGDLPMLNLFRSALLFEDVYSQWSKVESQERWRRYREELVLRLIPRRAKAADEQHRSARALKYQIDRDLNKATMIFTAIPMVALIVAALGVGNLMTANVTSRTRQIAMLRAVGATKWQITRLIIGEAIVLGALGSLLGLGLGLHAAMGLNALTESIWGYRPVWTIPWNWIASGVGFTLLVCLVAGILPARRASRNNIIDALQTT